MEIKNEESGKKNSRSAGFGNGAKFGAYMEHQTADSECANCPGENEYGELILLECSWEAIF